ncbi:MAG: hypothetical protein IT381_27495 [Deltaproteobacteria bacterium]|nr:hypothetical protein [Deltaproteobacteria bacterium]
MRKEALLAIALVSCGAISFTLEQNLGENTIQGSLLGGLLPGFALTNPKLNFDIKQETEKRNTGPASAVVMESFVLYITPQSAPSGNFDFLTALDVFVSAPGLSETKIASLPKLDKGATKITMTLVSGVNMLPYVNAGATIRAAAQGTQPSQTTTFSGDVVVRVRI